MKAIKTYNLTKTRNGQRNSVVISQFSGESIDDAQMINEARDYMRSYLEGVYNAMTYEELDAEVAYFDGSMSYDVYSYELVEVDNEE